MRAVQTGGTPGQATVRVPVRRERRETLPGCGQAAHPATREVAAGARADQLPEALRRQGAKGLSRRSSRGYASATNASLSRAFAISTSRLRARVPRASAPSRPPGREPGDPRTCARAVASASSTTSPPGPDEKVKWTQLSRPESADPYLLNGRADMAREIGAQTGRRGGAGPVGGLLGGKVPTGRLLPNPAPERGVPPPAGHDPRIDLGKVDRRHLVRTGFPTPVYSRRDCGRSRPPKCGAGPSSAANANAFARAPVADLKWVH